MLAKQLLEDGPEGVSDDERAATRDTVRRTSSKSYHEEQEELRSAFLGAAADGDEEAEASDEDDDSDGGSGGGFMTKKVKSAAERAKEAEVDRDIAERRAQKEAEAGAQEASAALKGGGRGGSEWSWFSGRFGRADRFDWFVKRVFDGGDARWTRKGRVFYALGECGRASR